jgi:hypothetical protein
MGIAWAGDAGSAESGWTLAPRRMRSQDAHTPPMRALSAHSQLLITALILMLAAGNGLSGIVRVLAATDGHVCTCASGGSHASCPVCSHALGTPSRSRLPIVDGRPCGDRHPGTMAACAPVTLPAPSITMAPRIARLNMPAIEQVDGPDRSLEPATPPPRIALPG